MNQLSTLTSHLDLDNSPVQLIVEEEPRSGAWNMAFDEALLDKSLATNQAFVRLYRWSEATVSLGYFQAESELAVDPRLTSLPFVRRLSGGGAILHHHEQTYSCCVPPRHPLAEKPYQLYERIHTAITECLAESGVTLQPRGRDDKSRPEPFLCFQREAAPDLIFQGRKVLGSAQRRRRGAILQHGSLLLRRSEHLPELPGLWDLSERFVWTDGLCRELGLRIGQVVSRPMKSGVSSYRSEAISSD